MRIRTPLLLALPAGLALSAQFHIEVGSSGLTFSPQTITAKKGDVVIFTFYPSHDVAQASFADPCIASSSGFYSGAFASTDGGTKKFVLTLNNTDPIYYYCSVQKHCQSGMVGGINLPKTGNTIEAFASAAKSASKTTRPNGLTGGLLLTDAEIQALSGGGGNVTTPTTASPSTSGTSNTPSGSATASGSPSAPQSGAAAPAPSGSATTGTAAGSPSGSASPQSTSRPAGAANAVGLGSSGIMAGLLGVVAWFL